MSMPFCCQLFLGMLANTAISGNGDKVVRSDMELAWTPNFGK